MATKSRFSRRSREAELSIELLGEPFDPWRRLSDRDQKLREADRGCGACSSFVGIMRPKNDGLAVREMILEYYPKMTQRQLSNIVDEAYERWPIEHIDVVHRVGTIRPGDTIVLVGVWSAHRGPAINGCRHILEHLKRQAPFWKKEILTDGSSRWVTGNTDVVYEQ